MWGNFSQNPWNEKAFENRINIPEIGIKARPLKKVTMIIIEKLVYK